MNQSSHVQSQPSDRNETEATCRDAEKKIREKLINRRPTREATYSAITQIFDPLPRQRPARLTARGSQRTACSTLLLLFSCS